MYTGWPSEHCVTPIRHKTQVQVSYMIINTVIDERAEHYNSVQPAFKTIRVLRDKDCIIACEIECVLHLIETQHICSGAFAR